MQSTSSHPTGFVAALRNLGDVFLAGTKHRIELISIELQEEKLRLIQILIWFSIAAFTAVMTLILASITLISVFWETARLTALGGLTLLYASAVVLAILMLRHHIIRQPKPFAATLAELAADRACIHNPN